MNDWLTDTSATHSSSDESDSQFATLTQSSRLRPASSALTFVPFANWKPGQSYDDEPVIRYNVEWKLSINNREKAGESELGVALSPQKFWRHVLRPKVAAEVMKKPCEPDKTKIVLSVSDRKTPKIKKEFPKTDVEWSFVASQVQEWSKFLNDGKTISVTITFCYRYVDSDRPGGNGRGARALQNAEREAVISTEIAALGRPACFRKAYALMRCPGSPCNNGSHCWQNGGKHYRLLPHHMKMLADHLLADHLLAGKVLNGHDDVPDNFRQLFDEEREKEQREQKERGKRSIRKRRRRDSGDSLEDISTALCHRCMMGGSCNTAKYPSTPAIVFPSSPLMGFHVPRDQGVRAYSAWQQDQVESQEQKEYYRLVQDLTLANCFDLDMIASNQERMYRFYKQHDIPDGVAWKLYRN